MIIDPDLLLRLENPKALAEQNIFNQWMLYISCHREVGVTPWRDTARDMPILASIPFDMDANTLAQWLTDPEVEKQLEKIWEASQLSQGYEATIGLRRVLESMIDGLPRLTLVETGVLVQRAQDVFLHTETCTLDGLVHDTLKHCLGPKEFNPVSGFPHGGGLVDLGMALAGALVERIAQGTPVSPTLWREGLFHALRSDNLKAVEVLLDWGVKVNCLDHTKATPLNVARSKEAAWMLLDQGATQTGLSIPLADHTIEWVMEWNSQKDLEALKKAVLTGDNKPYIKRKL